MNRKIYQQLKNLIILLVSLVAVSLSAQDFKVGALSYNIIGTNIVELCAVDSNVVMVDIPDSVTNNDITYSVVEIADGAFSDCDALESVFIPSSVTRIRILAFYTCKSLISITVDAANPKYDSRDNCNAVIDTKQNMLVVACKNTTIPQSVMRIKEHAFSAVEEYNNKIINTHSGVWYFDDCLIIARGLYFCAIKDGTRLIADNAFFFGDALPQYFLDEVYADYGGPQNFCEGCNSFLDVYDAIVYREAPYFADHTFNLDFISSYNRLSRVIIPNSVKSIGARAFAGAKFKNITIPSSVEYIGESAFYGCDSLVSVDIPDSVVTLERMAFYGCYNLKQVRIGNAITTLEHSVFSGCESLSDVEIGNGVVHIDSDAFSGCTSLKEISIPNNVMTISDQAIPEHCEVYF